jgi:hypothetical protein
LTFVLIAYSILTFISAILVQIFPETKGKEMPNTVRDAEKKKEKKRKNAKEESSSELEANNLSV